MSRGRLRRPVGGLGAEKLALKRADDLQGFVVLPRRRVVERTPAWTTWRRRCVGDYERLAESHEAMVRWAMTLVIARRVAR